MFYSRIELSSDISKLIEVEKFIDFIMSDCSLPEQYRGLLAAPMMEAAKNAIVHGNGNDSRKKIQILCRQQRDKLVITVADEGKGFPYEQYHQSGQHLRTDGLSVIHAICNDVEFQQNGSVIVFSVPVPIRQKLPQHTIKFDTIASSVLQTK